MGWDVVIVGGGPAGCSAAEKIARDGFNVLILEENKRIGEPVQCAGLVSPRTLKLAGYRAQSLNSLKGAHIYAPSGEILECRGSQTYALAIERAEFDRHLAEKALEQGASLLLEAKACNFGKIKRGVTVNFEYRGKNHSVETKLLIGADGVNSVVSRWAGLQPPEEKIRMFAADVELGNTFPETVDLFLGSNIAPGWFGWIIPLNKGRARIGTGSCFYHRTLVEHVKLLFRKYPQRFKNLKIIKGADGLVPIGMMKNYAAHVMVVGDAACQTKPVSGGGLYLGLRGAEICAQVAKDALKQDDFSQEFLARYQAQWDREAGLEIEQGLKYRRMFLELTDNEISNIIRFLNTEFWKRQILKNGDIDYPSILGEKLFFAPHWAEKFIFSCLRKAVSN